MGKVFESISPKQREWIEAQKIFFVATAPLAEDGLINVSPKGLNTFKVIDDHTVAYLDLAGSGIETIAHIQENGRITIMFTAFEGPPKSLRLYGNGQVLKHGSDGFNDLSEHFNDHLGSRSIIKVDLHRIQDSCGWSIPLFEYKGDRDVYDKYCENKGRSTIVEDIRRGNKESIDGLRGY